MGGAGDGGDGFKLWQSLVRQTELTAQLCSIMRDVRNVRGGTQKKIEKLRHLLSGLLSELTYFEEVICVWFAEYKRNWNLGFHSVVCLVVEPTEMNESGGIPSKFMFYGLCHMFL